MCSMICLLVSFVTTICNKCTENRMISTILNVCADIPNKPVKVDETQIVRDSPYINISCKLCVTLDV